MVAHDLGYLSTTGVYGDRDGGWVDETSRLLPTGERGRRRIAAEQGWLDLWNQSGVPIQIFRLAAIYGPGRSAFDSLRAGTAPLTMKLDPGSAWKIALALGELPESCAHAARP